MNEIKTVSMVGLGALGAGYASALQPVLGDSFRVVAEGERAERLAGGLNVNGREFRFRTVAPGESVEPADLVLVAVKFDDLPRAIDDIAGHVGPDTLVMSLMNGIDSEERLAARYGRGGLLYAFSVGGGYIRRGRDIIFPIQATVNFGDATNVAPYSDGVRRVMDLFDRCSIPYAIPEDMIKAMWWKFMVNTSINQLSAILDGPYGLFQAPGAARELMIEAMQEIRHLATLRGIDMVRTDVEHWLHLLDTKNSPDGETSMLQDVRNGRRTEFRSFGGVVLRLADEAGLKMPVNEMIYRMMEAVEQRTALNAR